MSFVCFTALRSRFVFPMTGVSSLWLIDFPLLQAYNRKLESRNRVECIGNELHDFAEDNLNFPAMVLAGEFGDLGLRQNAFEGVFSPSQFETAETVTYFAVRRKGRTYLWNSM